MSDAAVLDADLHYVDPTAAAKAARLRYVSDDEPGIRRKRWGKGFSYLDPDGGRVEDADVRRRIDDLVIPPAWNDVWICRTANGHIQATGRDDAGRKQYIYHPKWREVRDRAKFDHLERFAECLPRLRRRLRHHLNHETLDKVKVTAAIIRLMDATLVRIGNRRYAKESKSYGLTTLRDKHVNVSGDEISLSFNGKGGGKVVRNLRDWKLAEVVRDCQDIPGYQLFQYHGPDGKRHTIDSSDVNAYLREVAEFDVSAKDFRTWGGTVGVARTLHTLGDADSARRRKANAVQAIKEAADLLGNTPSICRASYVHPSVLEAYSQRVFVQQYAAALEAARDARDRDHRLHEAATLGFLRLASPG